MSDGGIRDKFSSAFFLNTDIILHLSLFLDIHDYIALTACNKALNIGLLYFPNKTALTKRCLERVNIPFAISLFRFYPSIDPTLEYIIENVIDYVLRSPIDWATYYGHAEFLVYLLTDSRIDPSYDGLQIGIAAGLDHVSCVRILLEDPRIDPSVSNNHGIYRAASCGSMKSLNVLMQDERIRFNEFDLYYGLNALQGAAFHKKVKSLKRMMFDERFDWSVAGISILLTIFYKSGDEDETLEILRMLLEDERVRPSQEQYYIALQNSCKLGYLNLIKFLLMENRGNPSAHGHFCVKNALNDLKKPFIDILLADHRIDFSKVNIIQEAMQNDSYDVYFIRSLLEYPKSDPSLNKNIAFSKALIAEKADVCWLLLQDHRVNPMILNDNHSFDEILPVLDIFLSDIRLDECVKIIGHRVLQFASNSKKQFQLLLEDSRVDPGRSPDYGFVYPIIYVAQNGNLDCLKMMLADPRVDPSVSNNLVFRIVCGRASFFPVIELVLTDTRVSESIKYIDWLDVFRIALKKNDTKLFELLLKYFKYDFNILFIESIISKKIKITRLLLDYPQIDPSKNNNEALLVASKSGEKDIVRLLLTDKRVNPSIPDQLCIQTSSSQVFSILINDERICPSLDENICIRNAAKDGNVELVSILMQDSRVKAAGIIYIFWNINETDCANSAIKLACEYFRYEVVAWLVMDKEVEKVGGFLRDVCDEFSGNLFD